MKHKILFLVFALSAIFANATSLNGLRIYVNPGHGGYDSDDRNIVIYPYLSGDHDGFWESKSNLIKGLALRDILESFGATVMMSRTTNTTADDLGLSVISSAANNFDADFFVAIHSNAGEAENYPLMLYRGYTSTPVLGQNIIDMSRIIWEELHESELPIWTRNNEYLAGDFDFYPDWNNQGLGVLRYLTRLGMLSEGQMHEHRPECYRMMNNDYLWLEAWHFTHSIMRYFNTDERFTTGNISGIVYDNNNLREKYMPAAFTQYGRDKFAPVCGGKVELYNASNEIVDTYNIDNMYNGVYVFKNVAPGAYTMKFSHSDFRDKVVPVTVEADKILYKDMAVVYKHEEAPELTQYTPNVVDDELVSCGTTIELQFSSDMDESSIANALKITPALEGNITSSLSKSHFTFKPAKAFATNTKYTVKVTTDARTMDEESANRNMKEDVTFTFNTKSRNVLTVNGISNNDGDEIHYKSPTIEFITDALLESATTKTSVNVYDESNNTLAFSSRNVKINQVGTQYGSAIFPLAYNFEAGKTYRVEIDGNVHDQEQIPLADKITLHLKAVDMSIEKPGCVIDTFEDATVYTYDDVASVDVKSASIAKYTTDKLFGTASSSFKYAFNGSEGGSIRYARTISEDSPIVSANKAIGVNIFGNLSFHKVSLEFTSGEDVKVVPLAIMNFRGWKFVEVVLSSLEQGKEYKLSGIILNQGDINVRATGNILLDQMIVNDSPLGVSNPTVDGLNVSPTLADNYINIECNETINDIKLIDTLGRTVLTSTTNTLNTSDIPNGNYIVKVSTNNASETVKVVIKH